MSVPTGERGQASQAATRRALDLLETVHQSPSFRDLMDTLWALQPGEERQRFVRDVLVVPEELRKAGVELPAGVTLQRTYFDDDRPTLFALVVELESGLPFSKVTITFDDVDSTAPPAPKNTLEPLIDPSDDRPRTGGLKNQPRG